MEGPTPCLFESKKGRDGGALPPPREPLGVPRGPLYIFILCNKYKKKAGRRQGGIKIRTGTPL